MSDPILARLVRGDRDHEVLWARLGAANPFCTAAYASAMQSFGREVWIVGLQSGPSGAEAALGCIARGKLSVELEFPSLPAIAGDPRFWAVVDSLCERAGVTDIVAGSFGSLPFELPPLRGELSREMRQEFVLRLRDSDPASLLSSNHKRNVKKAQKAGVTVRRTRENIDWLRDHTILIAQSAQRRIARGESVATNTSIDAYRGFLEHGAGELFQAVLGSTVVSSVLVLLSPQSGYYHSAGTSPDGMNGGASHFLIHRIASILSDEGRQTFNLGGAEEGSSLARFKLGFGPETLSLPAATCYVGPAWKKKLRTAIRLVRHDREGLMRVLTGSSLRLLVFRLDTETVAAFTPVPPIPDTRLELLTEEKLAVSPSPIDDVDFRNRQMELLRRFGNTYGYAVYVGGKIGHISWLLPPSIIRSEVPAVLQLKEDEAEITGCETAPEFRGKGLYGYAIQSLAKLALGQGIRRIYMKTLETNVVSQSGMRKAGLIPIGSVRLINPPLATSRTIIRRSLAP